MPSWVWEIRQQKGKSEVILCEVKTRWEILSALVGKGFDLCIPGTYNIFSKLIGWLDDKPTVLYVFPVSEEVLARLDLYFGVEGDESEEEH